MVRVLGERMAERARGVSLRGVELIVQGSRLVAGGLEAELTPRERSLLRALLDAEGVVVSKPRLAAAAWGSTVDDHAVEVAVGRLRRKLGPAAGALETTSRRGYRLVTA
jgi:uroporphyrinogen-III synthase